MTIIVEVMNRGKQIAVHKKGDRLYDVMSGTKMVHPNCTAEDVMRALGNYLEDGSTEALTLCNECSRFIPLDANGKFIPHHLLFKDTYCENSLKGRK